MSVKKNFSLTVCIIASRWCQIKIKCSLLKQINCWTLKQDWLCSFAAQFPAKNLIIHNGDGSDSPKCSGVRKNYFRSFYHTRTYCFIHSLWQSPFSIYSSSDQDLLAFTFYPPKAFCLYPCFCLSISFSLFFLFLSIFFLYLSSLSLSKIPCQCTSPVKGHRRPAMSLIPSSVSSANSSSILFNNEKLKYFTHIRPLRPSIGCCSSSTPECGCRYTIFLALW